MKFLIDAQLPYLLAKSLQEMGFDTLHTLDLPAKNSTRDTEINFISLRDERIVVTKDDDFVTSFYLEGKPYKLLFVSTGNISNKELQKIFKNNLSEVVRHFHSYAFVELTRESIIIHS